MEQIGMFEMELPAQLPVVEAVSQAFPVPPEDVDPTGYDRVVVFFSGGKDSEACVLHLLEQGVDPAKIELHHHLVDGRGSRLMDWPVTDAYCTAFAQAFGLKLYFSFKEGGFEREMLRKNARTAPIVWERQDGTLMRVGGDGGKLGTRWKFPQVAADLRVRWCSAYLKIDVGARILTTEPRFRDGRTLVVTGERAEESACRARYHGFEPHRSDNRDGARVQRHIDQWRPIHGWSEEEVWAIIRRHNVNPHPAYHLGFGRTSCQKCIFGSQDQWATVRVCDPEGFERVAEYEDVFESTIHRTRSVREQADRGTPYAMDPAMIALAMSREYPQELLLTPPGTWQYPQGAFGESTGPL